MNSESLRRHLAALLEEDEFDSDSGWIVELEADEKYTIYVSHLENRDRVLISASIDVDLPSGEEHLKDLLIANQPERNPHALTIGKALHGDTLCLSATHQMDGISAEFVLRRVIEMRNDLETRITDIASAHAAPPDHDIWARIVDGDEEHASSIWSELKKALIEEHLRFSTSPGALAIEFGPSTIVMKPTLFGAAVSGDLGHDFDEAELRESYSHALAQNMLGLGLHSDAIFATDSGHLMATAFIHGALPLKSGFRSACSRVLQDMYTASSNEAAVAADVPGHAIFV